VSCDLLIALAGICGSKIMDFADAIASKIYAFVCLTTVRMNEIYVSFGLRRFLLLGGDARIAKSIASAAHSVILIHLGA